jgi:cell division protein FtsI/penicillin-binding protein 2
MQSESVAPTPVRRRSRGGLLVAVVAIVLLLVVAIAYAVNSARTVDAQVRQADQALKLAIQHRDTVDKAINDYVGANVPSDPAGYKALVDKDLPEVEAALSTVRNDQAAVQAADANLGSASLLTLTKRDGQAAEAKLTLAARSGLANAEQVLVDIHDQLLMLQPLVQGVIEMRGLIAKAQANDLNGALAAFASAKQQVQTALDRSHRADIPAEFGVLAGLLKSGLDALQQEIAAIQANNPSAARQAQAQLQALSDQFDALKVRFDSVDASNRQMFQPLIDSYHKGVQAATVV